MLDYINRKTASLNQVFSSCIQFGPYFHFRSAVSVHAACVPLRSSQKTVDHTTDGAHFHVAGNMYLAIRFHSDFVIFHKPLSNDKMPYGCMTNPQVDFHQKIQVFFGHMAGTHFTPFPALGIGCELHSPGHLPPSVQQSSDLVNSPLGNAPAVAPPHHGLCGMSRLQIEQLPSLFHSCRPGRISKQSNYALEVHVNRLGPYRVPRRNSQIHTSNSSLLSSKQDVNLAATLCGSFHSVATCVASPVRMLFVEVA